MPEHLRGYLERLLQEVRTGLYVGTVTARVAEKLWAAVDEHALDGDAIMIRPDNNESGYTIVARNHPRWYLADIDGWVLSATRKSSDPS